MFVLLHTLATFIIAVVATQPPDGKLLLFLLLASIQLVSTTIYIIATTQTSRAKLLTTIGLTPVAIIGGSLLDTRLDEMAGMMYLFLAILPVIMSAIYGIASIVARRRTNKVVSQAIGETALNETI